MLAGRGSGFVAVEIPFTPRAKRVLELSLEEARQLGVPRSSSHYCLSCLLKYRLLYFASSVAEGCPSGLLLRLLCFRTFLVQSSSQQHMLCARDVALNIKLLLD